MTTDIVDRPDWPVHPTERSGERPEAVVHDRDSAPLSELDDALAKLHASHDCNPGPCICKCGCVTPMGCRTALGGLCSTCHLEAIYDEGDCGFPEPAQTASGLQPERSDRMDKL